ncbi:MAG TPA: ABC transporter ATP-binding protein, partial [Hyphomicrobiaceae bacterium]|nr:ABC transporter ATP-binding protein [Hyphomicrobiaceae bacterium]
LAARKPRELSGGQQQRVALARALVIEPDVLLLDESLSNLDAKLRDAMRLEIRDLQRALSLTTLFVTHDQTEALTMCDRIAVMNAGRIEQVASPRDIYDRPASRFVADFVGRSNVLNAAPDASGRLALAGRALRLAKAPPPGSVEIFLRPQRLMLREAADALPDALNGLAGRIAASMFVGDRIELAVETEAGRLIVELPHAADAPPVGREVMIAWRPEDTLAFAVPAT